MTRPACSACSPLTRADVVAVGARAVVLVVPAAGTILDASWSWPRGGRGPDLPRRGLSDGIRRMFGSGGWLARDGPSRDRDALPQHLEAGSSLRRKRRRRAMAKTTQLVLSLKSKPGVLAGISRSLADARVNILSLSAAEAAGRGKIRMTVSNPVVAKRALRKSRVRFVEEVAFAKRLRNKPGALARLVEKLARGRVNIRSAYATTAGRGGATVVITVGTAAKARKIIGS